jgi:diguanylate cyclase (GGDEF)-like protein
LIVRFALIQAVGVGLFGLSRNFGVTTCVLYTILVAGPALLATYRRANQRLRTVSATVSLMSASATIVDLANGSDIAHFHFFVMVGVVALYQDWVAFGVCILITILHHAVLGSIDPNVVYGDSAERQNPIVWSLIHGAFVLASSITYLIAWKANEQQELSDTVTRLPNRTAFVESVQQILSDPEEFMSIIYLDIDNFKQINDSAGHLAGDQILRHVGERMLSVVRQGDSLARLGGDEFAIYVLGTSEIASAIATRLLHSLQKPIVIGDREILLHVSIGIADTDLARSRHCDDLIRDADLAMYLAKASGGNRIATYTAGVDTAVRQRAELAADLGGALASEEFEMHYQPVVRGADGSLTGVEALIRWRHPTRGFIMPSEFIPLAEETGEIRNIGGWVLRTTIAQVVQWQKSLPNCEQLNLTVNLSAVQLRDEKVVDMVSSTFQAAGLDPRRLTLEVTESMLMADLDVARLRLDGLRSMGVRIAIDDFGTGYSSLSYLSNLPADVIKIDRSFVQGLDDGTGSSVLTKAIVDMATALDLDTVAEGVETLRQQVALSKLGCHLSQGYLYSPGLPAAEFEEYARRRPVGSESGHRRRVSKESRVNSNRRGSFAGVSPSAPVVVENVYD